eukprot:GEMP01002980.1.p1 GENE.GEMP01002980.1~~GEMP01002980.1.p1  ORF type:complete len:1027 (+),score=279.41 GEMP01002980.1:472-3552(+)
MSPIADIVEKLANKASVAEALNMLKARVSEDIVTVEPFVVQELDKVLEKAADKANQSLVMETVEALITRISPFGIATVMPILLANSMGKSKPLQKEVSLKLITMLAKKEPTLVSRELITLVPAISDLMNDVKKDVASAARECMGTILYCSGNTDLEPFIPFVLEAIIDLNKAAKCVEKLASCVFVQNVEGPALAVTVPVLQRGLRDRNEELKRTCCVIIDNMCKLVEDPREVLPLLSRLEPLVKTASESIGDPEARGIAEKAYKILKKSADAGTDQPASVEITLEISLEVLDTILGDKASSIPVEIRTYVAALGKSAGVAHNFNKADWESKICNYLKVDGVAAPFLEKIEKLCDVQEEEEEDDGEGRELYKGSFSLAYGTLTLLRDTKMNLKWNKFYGLLGPNNCGKTTMMRAIGNEQLEGFPTRAELLSVFVEHEIQEREVGVQDDGFPIMNVDLSGIDWVVDTINNVYNVPKKVTQDEVRTMLEQLGFGKNRAADPDGQVTTYSGGWKMKMQLCAAALLNADVLMLDEPTGHLDVDNIEWLKRWLGEFPGTIICTSHDSKFLDAMCDYIIDFQDRKLKSFRGDKGKTLSQFVEKHPEKQGYFELKNDVVKFVFPEPGPLEGIKSRTKIILKMTDVFFTYPTKKDPTIMDINLKVTQVSRVAVIGANGAGKSTAIKVLVGEATAQSGTVFKAQGMRMAYVAQHAFHHLESHLDKTPTAYIMWRFAGNDDRESLDFKADELSTSEEALREAKWIIDPVRLTVRKLEKANEEKHVVIPESIMNRRLNKKEKTKDYEVKWQFKDVTDTMWVDRETLIKMGYIKFVQREDEKQAAMAGLQTKHLTSAGVEKHLVDFGIDPETASHTSIRHLSGGQKVKVVIAASMWQNPHLLILDEPTNYLDRDGLGALTLAIREYKGGVLVISHNREFCEGVAQEKWIMQAGRLRIEGESINDEVEKQEQGNKTQEDVLDAQGNIVDVKAQKTLSEKEKKKQIKLLEKKLKEGKKKNLLTEEEEWEITDQITALSAVA